MSLDNPEDLLSELSRRESEAQSGGAELRRWRRLPIRGEAELYPMDANRLDRSPLEIAIRDLSWDGLGVLSNELLQNNSRWRCCFLKDGYTIGQQPIVVVHGEAIGPSAYLIGCQFILDAGLTHLLGADVTMLGEGRF